MLLPPVFLFGGLKDQLSLWSSCTAQHQITSFFVFQWINSPFARLVLLNIKSLLSLCFAAIG